VTAGRVHKDLWLCDFCKELQIVHAMHDPPAADLQLAASEMRPHLSAPRIGFRAGRVLNIET
jgi:hypothetical protein